MIDWLELIESGDAEALAAMAGNALGLRLPPAPFLAECKAKAWDSLGSSCGKGFPWSDGTWRAWLKNRALALNCYQVVGAGHNEVRWASCTLHVGFLFIEENEDHINNLLRVDEPPATSRVARSKIAETNLVIQPIDGVADRVAQGAPPHAAHASRLTR